MRAYLIDPVKQDITEVEYSGDYNQIYELIDCQTFDAVTFGEHEDTVFIDDEGLINGKPQDFFVFDDYPNPLAGRGLVLGCDEEGDSVEPKITLEELKDKVKFIPGMFIRGWRAQQEDENEA